MDTNGVTRPKYRQVLQDIYDRALSDIKNESTHKYSIQHIDG